MATADAGFEALDASVDTSRSGAQQEYLDAVADADEAAVRAAEETITHLKASLADRKAQAKASRAAARAGRE